jgi:hypothetical protein
MGLTSTHFISYHDIKVEDVDLIEDAWGLRTPFSDVIELMDHLKIVPEEKLTQKLIRKIREHH